MQMDTHTETCYLRIRVTYKLAASQSNYLGHVKSLYDDDEDA